jgi:hypothetical protein
MKVDSLSTTTMTRTEDVATTAEEVVVQDAMVVVPAEDAMVVEAEAVADNLEQLLGMAILRLKQM